MSIYSEPLVKMMSHRNLVSRLKLLILATVVFVVAAGVAQAHHSFTATYFEEQSITIKGTVLQFQFRNPHSFVHVQAPDENGELHRWAVEWGGSSQLSNSDLNAATLRPGDIIEVTGRPGRDPADHRVHLVYLLRPADGFDWGNEPGETFD